MQHTVNFGLVARTKWSWEKTIVARITNKETGKGKYYTNFAAEICLYFSHDYLPIFTAHIKLFLYMQNLPIQCKYFSVYCINYSDEWDICCLCQGLHQTQTPITVALSFIPIQLEVFTKLIVDDRSILICTMTATAAVFIIVTTRNVDYMLTDVDTYNSMCLRKNHLLLD